MSRGTRSLLLGLVPLLLSCGEGTGPESRAATAVVSGNGFSCALVGAAAYCWGRNDFGQLGLGIVGQDAGPLSVFGSHRFRALAAGERNVCGITVDNEILCWGHPALLGLATPVHTPTRVDDGEIASPLSIGVGFRHACALTQGGAAWCWGENPQGELGNGTLDPADGPTPVSGGRSYSTLSVGAFHSCGIAQADVYCWGWNFSFPLGPGTVNLAAHPVPVAVTLPFDAAAVEAGSALTCAVDSATRAWCWGINRTAQLGRGVAGDPVEDPQRVEVIGQVSAIASGALNSIATHVCALDSNRVAWCWGNADAAQVGAPASETCESGGGLSPCLPLPAPLDSDVAFLQLAPGRDHTCAIGEDGAVYCWGSDARRQLGGTVMGGQSIAPVRVPMG